MTVVLEHAQRRAKRAAEEKEKRPPEATPEAPVSGRWFTGEGAKAAPYYKAGPRFGSYKGRIF